MLNQVRTVLLTYQHLRARKQGASTAPRTLGVHATSRMQRERSRPRPGYITRAQESFGRHAQRERTYFETLLQQRAVDSAIFDDNEFRRS